MTYELTKKGLFSYFDPKEVCEIIELPLIQHHMSTYQYNLCRAECSTPLSAASTKKKYASKETVLDFEALQCAPIANVIEYLNITNVRAAYVQVYGKYFIYFESQVLASKNEPCRLCGELFPVIDEISEQKLILSIKAATSLPILAFNNALLQQDFLLQSIALVFKKQASNAQDFIAQIQGRDIAHKESVINLAFSFVKLSLSMINMGELLNVGARFSELAAYAFEEIEARLPALVLQVQELVATTHYGVLAEAEKGLFSTVLPEDIESCWAEYRIRIFEKANSAIADVLKNCVANDDFFRCIIREVLCQQKNVTYDMLYIKAAEKTEHYFKVIAEGLLAQVAKIRHMRDAVVSEEGTQKIGHYYRQLGLINFAKQHEMGGSLTQQWLTKETGHRISFYFPEVFQKKWTGTFYSIFHRPVPYCKQLMSLEEYKQRKQKAVVVLAAVGNSVRVKEELYMYLEEQAPRLRETLFRELRELKPSSPQYNGFVSDGATLPRRGRYSFTQSDEVFLDFTNARKAWPPAPAAEPSPPPTTPALLRAHRSLAVL